MQPATLKSLNNESSFYTTTLFGQSVTRVAACNTAVSLVAAFGGSDDAPAPVSTPVAALVSKAERLRLPAFNDFHGHLEKR